MSVVGFLIFLRGCISKCPTIMTVKMCEKYKIPVKGIIINNFDSDGYKIKELTRDFKNLNGVPILGSIPFIEDISDSSMYKIFKKNLNMKLILK
jgi:dethiobiotin synthetase